MSLMARKTSIYVDETTDKILAARDGEKTTTRRHGHRSQIFREMIRRYDELCRNDVPDLTETEREVLLQAGSTWATSNDNGNGAVRMGSLFGAATDSALLKKLLGFSSGQRFALIDYIERYWAAKARGEAFPDVHGQQGETGKAHARSSGRK
jgi:hypothetical protein